MPLRNVTFANWLRTHVTKGPDERWLRELYPWPVLALVEVDKAHVGATQRIVHGDVEYLVTLTDIQWQPTHGTYRYRLFIDSEGLGWHARSFADDFVMCGAPDGSFVTLFHAKDKEPLEKMARDFFGGRWGSIPPDLFKTLAVSRFLAATLVGLVVEAAFAEEQIAHYPDSRLIGGEDPMFANGRQLWIGYRFFSEDAYAWARRRVGQASRVVALYFADTKYQFRTDLPPNAEVRSIAELDATANAGRYEDLIRILLRGNELPGESLPREQLESIVHGRASPTVPVTEADVHEALAALKRPCGSKAQLRYQLAAAVVLNAWIESERRLGFGARKKFYAFKQKVDALARWAADEPLPGVCVWAEPSDSPTDPILFVRVDGVDFSFHQIPLARQIIGSTGDHPTWSEVRLKPIAPLALAWARGLLEPVESGDNGRSGAIEG